MRIGPQEIILDGHRLFGNTVWTQGMQSHDAIAIFGPTQRQRILIKLMYRAKVLNKQLGKLVPLGVAVAQILHDVDDTETVLACGPTGRAW